MHYCTNLSKSCVKQEVDKEVDGRVCDHQHVAQSREIKLETSTVTMGLIKNIPQDLVNQRWQLKSQRKHFNVLFMLIISPVQTIIQKRCFTLHIYYILVKWGHVVSLYVININLSHSIQGYFVEIGKLPEILPRMYCFQNLNLL